VLTVKEPDADANNNKSKSVVIKRCIRLGDYLPSLPKQAREFFSTRYREKEINLNSQIHEVNEAMAIYCQQLLNLLDAFFVQNLITN
jgi:hypothetical protein